MAYTTLVKYDVRENVLRNWLKARFGESETATGDFVWSCTPAIMGSSGVWQVTAPCEITNDQQHQLRLASIPKRRPTFGSRKSTLVE